MRVKVISTLIMTLILVPLFANQVPTDSYIYNSDGKSVETPPSFRFDRVIYPENSKSSFSDLFIYDNTLFVLEKGNGTLITEDGERLGFYTDLGEPWLFGEVSGLFIGEECIYIADSLNASVAVFDRESRRNILLISDPDTSDVGVSFSFIPSKVIADKAGNIYVLVRDMYYGALMFSSSGEFVGFYGANPMELSLKQKLDQSWKKLMNREQRDAMERFVPVAYSSFDIDEENFVYTCSYDITDESMKIRRINPSGKGRYDGKGLVFGDVIPPKESVEGLENTSHFVDVDISNDILYALDAARGRIFVYDESGSLITVLAGKGTQKGTFTNSVAIESDDERIYVLDGSDSSITVVKKTFYGENLFSALSLYREGLYVEALPYINEVLRIAPELEIAHLMKGKAYQKLGDNKSALDELKLSGDREQYSTIFEKIRLSFARENLGYIMLAIIIVLVIYMILRKRYGVLFRLPGYVSYLIAPLFHPFDLMWERKKKKTFSYLFATILLLLYFLFDILAYFSTGYAFNKNNAKEFNILLSIMNTAGAFLLFVTVNWLLSTISEGNGTYKEIYCASSYALIPLLFSNALNLILSHVLSLKEGVFMTWIESFAFVWAFCILFASISTIHEYSFSKTMKNLLMTLIGMVFALFLLFLSVVLFENTANIFSIIYNEIALRV